MSAPTDLLNEWMLLSKIPRTGYFFLGGVQQSVAEHTYGMMAIAFVLAELCKVPIDREKLLLLALFHDVAEVRTGDLTPLNKRYVSVDLKKVLSDFKNSQPIGLKLQEIISEYECNESLEAKLVHDADQLELLITLKREYDCGNPSAMRWFDRVSKGLKTDLAKSLCEELRQTPYDRWWQNLS